MMGAVLVPILKDENGSTPADRWDFTERKTLPFHHSIPYKTVLKGGSDCVRFGINKSLVIPGMTLERQEQDWLLDLCRNSSKAELKVKIGRSFNKIPGHEQSGVLYLSMMLDTIINIPPDVAAGLKKKIKNFGEKGLRSMYPRGENVEKCVHELTSICLALDQLKILP